MADPQPHRIGAEKTDTVLVTTAHEIDGRRVSRYLGIVVRFRNIAQGILGSVRPLAGGSIPEIVDVCGAARHEARAQKIQHAEELGAHAIIAMRYDARERMQGATDVLAYEPGCGSSGNGRIPRCHRWPALLAIAAVGCSPAGKDTAYSPGPGLDAAPDGTEGDDGPDSSVDGGDDISPEMGGGHDDSGDGVSDTAVESADDAGIDADEPDGPPWVVDGVATCPELATVVNTGSDATAVLQMCLDRTPDGMVLEVDPGRYGLGGQVTMSRAIGLRTSGRAGTGPCTADASHGCAELFALPSLDVRFGMLYATGAVEIDHLVLHGNRQGRGGTHAQQMCATLADNAYGFNATLQCSGCKLTNSVSMYALCGTGMLVAAPATGVTIAFDTFAYNGVHTTQNMWSDGLTVHESHGGTFTNNTFVDNTDIDLIFGGCEGCTIRDNTVTHTVDPAAGSFAAIMIQKWPGTSGCYANVDVSGNAVDCGPLRNCGSGLYIGSESWYDETPYGTLTDGQTSGLITGNTVVNAMNALYIAARGMAIYGNGFLNAHGVAIPNSCHKSIVSQTPIVVSPTTASCHFNYENVDPGMSMHYSSASWAGCIPNYPF